MAGRSVSSCLWKDNIRVAQAALAHPFVQKLAKEELNKSAFEAYIQQDIFFLSAFARSYASAIRKAEESGLPVLQTLKNLNKEIEEELNCVHERFQESGQNTDKFKPSQATLNYTQFLEQVTETQDLAGIVAAMAPCNSLYAFLGAQIKESYPKAGHRYAEWIDFYASSDFHKSAETMEHLLDELAARNDHGKPSIQNHCWKMHTMCQQTLIERLAGRLAELYSKAMQLELEFFEAHLEGTVASK